jgi:hypothetical protein
MNLIIKSKIFFIMPCCLALLILTNSRAKTNVINAASPVPDTGQKNCYDNSRLIPCPRPGESFYGQDGNYSINPPEFKTKETESGKVIIDQVTGLIWQADIDKAGRTWSEAIDFTDSLAAAGSYEWRLPEKQELQSILNYGTANSASSLSQDKAGKNCLWSLTSRIFPSLVAMAVCNNDNRIIISNKNEKKNVLAVAGPAWKTAKLTDNGNGTVSDENTGLMWQATEARPMNWQHALAYCQALELGGFNDWRLPTVRELSTLVKIGPDSPALDPDFFPGCRPGAYWSGTTCVLYPAFAWYVDFADGLEKNSGYKKQRYFVRAVRNM